MNAGSDNLTEQTIHANQFVQIVVRQRDRELDDALNELGGKATEMLSVGELRQWYRAAEQPDDRVVGNANRFIGKVVQGGIAKARHSKMGGRR